jgi:4-hydroxy-tetrahydrodipicolinate synthase
MRSIRFAGVFTALVTPFDPRGRLDEAALRRLARRQVAGGVAGIVACGTTGEAPTLSEAEQERSIAVVAEEAARTPRRVVAVAGAGSNDTRKAARLAVRARRAGADAVLAVTPYYNKPTRAGLAAHFRAVADAAQLPVILYNVPGRTGVHLPADLVLELARDPRFAAVKEASGQLDPISEILAARPAGFAVLAGDDSLALAVVALGGDGVVSVVSNEAPEALVRLVDAARAGRRDEAAALHARLFPLMRANFVEANPAPVKWALARLGLLSNHLRLPLVPLSPAAQPVVERALGEAGLLAPVATGAR